MAVTPLYAGLLALLLIVLSVRVIAFRRRENVDLGHDGRPELERRIRAQANLAEYVPFALVLIGIVELAGFAPILLHVLGLALLAGRLLHGWALSFTDGSPQARVAGMALTFAAIGIAAVLNLVVATRAFSGIAGAG